MTGCVERQGDVDVIIADTEREVGRTRFCGEVEVVKLRLPRP